MKNFGHREPVCTLVCDLPILEETMLCTIIDIRGDYAYVKYQDTGVVSEVAIALLPFGVDVGDKLKFEDYEFSLA